MSTLDELRLSTTQRQRELLDAIWDYYRTHDRQWMPSRLLHQKWAASPRRARIWKRSVGPSCGTTTGTRPMGARYNLSLLGVLLTRDGADIERLLEAWLDYLVEQFNRDPLFKQREASLRPKKP